MVSREASRCSSESRRITKGPFCAALSPSLEVMGANRAMCDVPPDFLILFFTANSCRRLFAGAITTRGEPQNLCPDLKWQFSVVNHVLTK